MLKNRIGKMQLVQMISDEDSVYNFAERTAPPLGLLSIGTYIKKMLPDTEVEILDAAILSEDEIIKRLNAGLIGFSVNMWNYHKSLEIAQIAKSKGAIVVFGGHHATAVAENILYNREYIDFVITGDGEKSLFDLVNHKHCNEIQNLVYRIDTSIIKNNAVNIDIKELPIPDRSFVGLEPYYTNYRKALPESNFKKYTTFYSHKGCTWRSRKNGKSCVFCAIDTKGYRSRSQSQIWRELKQLNSTYGINYVMDVGDNLKKTWMKGFLHEKPDNLEMFFTGYIRANEIDEEFARILKELNFYSIFVGIESGDDSCLKSSNKGTTIKDNLNALMLLNDYGIEARLGVILGLPGESDITLSKTVKHIDSLSKKCKIEGIYSSILIPLPGSPSFDWVVNFNGNHDLLRSSDTFDIDWLRSLWLKYFTKVNYKDLIKVENEIHKMATPICQ